MIPTPPPVLAIVFALSLAACAGDADNPFPPDSGAGGAGSSGQGGGGRGGSGGGAASGVLPVVAVNTHGLEIIENTKIDATMYVVEDHDGTLKGIASRPHAFEGAIGIEIRGSSSTEFPKKSYNVELRDEAGADLDVPLLGMPEESDWVLYAPYTDKTFMRDKLAYDLGRDLGRYQPRSRFVEVFVNDVYSGVYVLIEKIRRGSDRVPIPKVAPDAATGDITGGYILKLEDGNADGGFRSAQRTAYQYHYPKDDEITSEQANYIQRYVNDFEGVMTGATFADPANGYAKWVDVPSFVDFAIITELSRNVDGYRKSAFMYKEPDAAGGRLWMGPLWDFNIAFGNADYCEGDQVQGFDYTGEACSDLKKIPSYWRRLIADPAFSKELRCRWESLRGGILSDAALVARLDAYREEVKVAEPRDHQTWDTLGEYVWPNPFVGATYSDEVGHLKEWLTSRAKWLDDHMPGTCQ